MLATYGATLPTDRWDRHLQVVRTLFNAWWEKHEEQVLPIPLINGDDLISEFNLESGPIIGTILEAVREAQISDEVSSKEDALQLAKKIMTDNLNTKTG
jgi:hypothetical protein